MLPPSFFDQLEDRFNLAVFDTNEEYRMSVANVTGLADTVRQTRSILADLPSIVDDMKTTAADVMANVGTVKALTNELKNANVELKAAIGAMSNGAPPLETTTISAPAIPQPSPVADNPDAVHDDTGAVIRPVLST